MSGIGYRLLSLLAFPFFSVPGLMAITISPSTATLLENATQQFTASANVTWSTTNCGTVASTGLFTAGLYAGKCSVTAKATDGSGAVATAAVTIASPITVSPTAPSTPQGSTQRFTASAPVTWQATNCGSIDTTGLFTASAPVGSHCTILATASSGPRFTTYNYATITAPSNAFSVAPANPNVPGATTLQFSATSASTWTTSCGTITSGGLFTAPLGPGTCTITATATDGSGHTAASVATITSPLTITPGSTTVPPSQTQQFTASLASTWTASCGSITAAALFTAPAAQGSVCTIKAVAATGPAYTATATATIGTASGFTLSPAQVTVSEGGNQQFTASANVASWTTTSCGTISSTGLFTALLYAGKCSVTAKASGSGLVATAAITITSPITMSPVAPKTPQGSTQQFTASAPVVWRATNCGSITQPGLFTASASVGSNCTILGTAASGPKYTIYNYATVVAPGTALSVSPLNPSVPGVTTQQFTATAAATWKASCGSITASGLFTAPLGPGSCAITATATDGSGHTANTTATITSPLVVSPASATTAQGQTQQFTANLPVNWTASCGSITAAGLFTASAAQGTVCTITGTASSGPPYTAKSSDTVGAPPALTVSPAQATVAENATQQFTANVAATWAASCGGIDASAGLFTAPLTTGGCTVTATASDGTGHTASATATITSPLAITPASATTLHGATQQFSANQPVNWTVSCGAIDATGLFTASATQGTNCTVTATVSSGTAYTATASDTVGAPVAFTVSPVQATVAENATQQFTATAPATWTADCGSIDASAGLFTAGLAPGTCNITATATDGSGNTATAPAKVPSPITIAPATATLFAIGTQQFTANAAVTWRRPAAASTRTPACSPPPAQPAIAR